jgi:hypothetical protein
LLQFCAEFREERFSFGFCVVVGKAGKGKQEAGEQGQRGGFRFHESGEDELWIDRVSVLVTTPKLDARRKKFISSLGPIEFGTIRDYGEVISRCYYSCGGRSSGRVF